MSIFVSAATLCGRRASNEDHVLAGNLLLGGNMALHAAAPPGEPILLAVADGIGGGIFPAESSQTALKALEKAFWNTENADMSLSQRLLQAALAANACVWALCCGEGGCTLTCAAIRPNSGEFAALGLGDSPIFLQQTAGRLRRLFLPQNEAARKKASGLRSLPGDSRVLLAFCGMSPDPGQLPFRLTSCGRIHPGEGLLLQTDGLTLSPGLLHRGLKKSIPAKELCFRALVRGSRDNISAAYALMK